MASNPTYFEAESFFKKGKLVRSIEAARLKAEPGCGALTSGGPFAPQQAFKHSYNIFFRLWFDVRTLAAPRHLRCSNHSLP